MCADSNCGRLRPQSRGVFVKKSAAKHGTLFIACKPYDMHTVETYSHSGWPAAIIPAMLFFQR